MSAEKAFQADSANNHGLELIAEHMDFVHAKTRQLNVSFFRVLREIAPLDIDYASNVFGLRKRQITAIQAIPYDTLVDRISVAVPLFIPIYPAPAGGYRSLLPYVVSKMESYAPNRNYSDRWGHIEQRPRDLVREFFMTYREMANADLDQAAAAIEVGREDIRRLRDRQFSQLMPQIDVIDPKFHPTVDDPADLDGNQARNILRHLNRETR